ncbi:MAG: helix-turn-helix domain-containing protein [Rhodospirillales bacterium]|nr:helix-turn-helix domain-containing protein [Rhodospirillales bacterium]
MARKGWHPEDIKAKVRKTGISLTDLALQNGLSESACRMAILYHVSPAGEKAIADHLNINPFRIWPARYNPDGTRSIGQNTIASKGSRHCEKSKVA